MFKRGAVLAALLLPGAAARADAPLAVTISVDATANQHQISPLIYGVNFATQAALKDLHATVNRSGGDSASAYNWRLDARNAGKDWYFESLPCDPTSINDQFGARFIKLTRTGGAVPMITIPLAGRVATLGAGRAKLDSFSIAKYGQQQADDAQSFPDAGNGVRPDGTMVAGNNPDDSTIPDDTVNEAARVTQLAPQFAAGTPHYYILGNEPSLWQLTNRDFYPTGAHASQIRDQVISYSWAVKSADPNAMIVAPEEWGWEGYFYSGFDQQYANTHGLNSTPDMVNQTGGMAYVPWLLSQWKAAGHPIDVFSLHFYPQGGEYSDAGEAATPSLELTRNRSTRDLWDPNYVDPTWINSVVALIPLMRHWADTYYYPGTPIAITEYSWGGDNLMNGATTEADILGIFGREGLNIATRWGVPPASAPVYKAIKFYRNYDNHGAAFGDTSISDTVPNPDVVSSFAALRSQGGAMTVMVINKQLTNTAAVTVSLNHFASSGVAQTWQLANNQIFRLKDANYVNGTVQAVLPAQSVTLFVLQGAAQ
jgi:hypothetical protein